MTLRILRVPGHGADDPSAVWHGRCSTGSHPDSTRDGRCVHRPGGNERAGCHEEARDGRGRRSLPLRSPRCGTHEARIQDDARPVAVGGPGGPRLRRRRRGRRSSRTSRCRATSGAELCARIGEMGRVIPVIVMTAFGSMETAIAAIRAGAYDFVTKPFDMDDLALTLERALKHRALRDEVKRLRRGVDDAAPFDDIVGREPGDGEGVRPHRARRRARRRRCSSPARAARARSSSPRRIHHAERARGGPVRRDQLRRDARDAPRERALRPREGRLHRRAHGAPGPLRARPPAARSSSTRSARCPRACRPSSCARCRSAPCARSAATQEHPFDVRIVAATNRDLETEVDERRFREDLFYRINVVRIHVPPLRARGQRHPAPRAALPAARSSRPGAARRRHHERRGRQAPRVSVAGQRARAAELHRARGRARAVRPHRRRRPARLGDAASIRRLRSRRPTTRRSSSPRPSFERRYVAQVMAAVNGNKTLAARILGLRPPDGLPEALSTASRGDARKVSRFARHP